MAAPPAAVLQKMSDSCFCILINQEDLKIRMIFQNMNVKDGDYSFNVSHTDCSINGPDYLCVSVTTKSPPSVTVQSVRIMWHGISCKEMVLTDKDPLYPKESFFRKMHAGGHRVSDPRGVYWFCSRVPKLICQCSRKLQYQVIFIFKEEKKLSPPPSSFIIDHLSSLFQNQTLADVIFNVQGVEMKGHSVILSAGSPVLAVMFQGNVRPENAILHSIEIEKTRPEVFKMLLAYLYTGTAPELEEPGTAKDLLVAADTYGVDSLKESCAVYLIDYLSVENAVDTLITAHCHSSKTLHEASLNFMAKNAAAVTSRPDWLELMKKYPELCFQATQFMFGNLNLK